MRIGIVGAGAIGLLFGAYLDQAGHQLTLFTRTGKQADDLERLGCQVELYSGERLSYHPRAIATETREQPVMDDIDLLLITVKQFSLPAVILWLKERLPVHVPLIVLMNGLGHEKIFSAQLPNPVYFGMTSSGATRLKSTLVVEKGRGKTRIGSLQQVDGECRVITKLIASLKQMGLDVSWSSDIESELWKKGIVNACINPLTALFQVPNGKLVSSPSLYQLMYQLYRELVPLVEKAKQKKAQKILNNGRLWQEIEEVCRNTSENKSSMLQDIQRKQQTEIEALSGYFLRLAETYQLSLPSHQFVYHAVCFLEQRGEEWER